MPRKEEPQLGLSRAIRHFRRKSELSQEALAFAAGLHPTSISHLESGRVNPTWGNVRRVARGLDVPLADLAQFAEELERRLGTAPRPGQGAGGR
jgi:transcriptional regulator with XRE-family HTH domain